jgi:acetyl-CoA carboxylase biotin carboxyl carrier protein
VSGRGGGAPLVAAVADNPDPHPALDRIDLLSPAVGFWVAAVTGGQIVQAGEPIGSLSVLGVAHAIVAGAGARGAVVAAGPARRPVAVGYGQPLVTLDRTVAESELHATAADDSAAKAAGDLVIRAPSSGRFYGRPGPGKPPFVAVGDPVRPGQTVGLLEVMKSFHRVTAGDELPAAARVTAIVVADDADVDAGAELVRLEVRP